MDKEQITIIEKGNLDDTVRLIDDISAIQKGQYDLFERINQKEKECLVVICDEMASSGKPAYSNETSRKAELTTRLSMDEVFQNDRESFALNAIDITNKKERVLLIKEHIRFLTALVSA